MMNVLLGVLIVEAVLLVLITILVIAAGVLIGITAHTQWANATGGIKGSKDPIMQFFRRQRKEDGSFELVPYDEVDDDPLRDKKEAEEKADDWESDYIDGAELTTNWSQYAR